jgi:hypothetical protein
MTKFACFIFVAGLASAMTTPAGAAQRSYNGTWPVTIVKSQFFNGTGCLTLEGSGRSGSATLTLNGQTYQQGSFLIMDGIFIASIVKPSGSQNGVLQFTAHGGGGRIGSGVFENLEGGAEFDAGSLAVGMKNGC